MGSWCASGEGLVAESLLTLHNNHALLTVREVLTVRVLLSMETECFFLMSGRTNEVHKTTPPRNASQSESHPRLFRRVGSINES